MDSGSFQLDEQSPDLPYVVYLQGWAHDWRIMSRCQADVNRIYVRECITPNVLPRLADFLKRSCVAPVSVVGWSLGGFAAVDFARMYPELVSSLVLVGIRSHYSPAEIESTKEELARDRKAFLEGFYRRNFLPAQRRDWAAFKADLLDSCLEEMDTGELMAGLDYLSSAVIDEKSLSVCRTMVVHGKQDVIAPVEDVRALAQGAGVPLHVIEDASHAAFLHAGFSEVLQHWLR